METMCEKELFETWWRRRRKSLESAAHPKQAPQEDKDLARSAFEAGWGQFQIRFPEAWTAGRSEADGS